MCCRKRTRHPRVAPEAASPQHDHPPSTATRPSTLGGPPPHSLHRRSTLSRAPGEWAGQTLRRAGPGTCGRGRSQRAGDAHGASRPAPSTRQQLGEIADEAQHVGHGVRGPGLLRHLLRRHQPGQDDLEGTETRPHQLPRRAAALLGAGLEWDPPQHNEVTLSLPHRACPPTRVGWEKCPTAPAAGQAGICDAG